ncbi:recombinase family protein [Hydrogenimonas sp.]
MIYAYLRQVPGSKSLVSQQQEVVGYALNHNLEIDKEVVEYSGKNRPIEERRQFEEFIHSLNRDDTLIVDEVWTLSSRVDEIVKIIGCTISRHIRLHVARNGVLITKDTPVGQVIPLINELRKETGKKSGGVGRPKGSKSRSKFDALQPEILQRLREERSVSSIAREFGVSRSSLKDYIESRDLKTLAQSSFMRIGKPAGGSGAGEDLLICPFEKEEREKQHKGVR